ncbi:transporter [Bradyrhizobium genosp. P]|uniref:transporter n=1 Tax=Bradyrhizobium genosp. P TaxID=83641 RepID=UPI003CF0A4CA
MTRLKGATLGSLIGTLVLTATGGSSFATEPGNLGNLLFGATMGAPIAAAPPPGVYFNNTFFYAPELAGNGNANCGVGCKSRYSGAVDSATVTWGSGLTFLGGVYFPTVNIVGDTVSETNTPYPPGGGPGASPIYGNSLELEVRNLYINPINFSWKVGNMPLFLNAGLGFVAPVGTDYAGSTVPDYWTIRPHWAVSYLGEGWNLSANFSYDINTASRGNTGLYQIIALNPATAPPVSALLTGPANPGNGYTTGDYLFLDWTATKKFDKWEIGPVGFVKVQTTDDTPGGVNPATRAAWTCAQLTAAKLPTCGKDVEIGAGLLVGYNFGPVDMKFIYTNAFYSKDTVGSNSGSTVWIKTSFRLWAPDEPPAPKKQLYTKN